LYERNTSLETENFRKLLLTFAEDVRTICPDVMRHRIGLTYEAEAESITQDHIISEIMNVVEVP
jgi:hypothetical protein